MKSPISRSTFGWIWFLALAIILSACRSPGAGLSGGQPDSLEKKDANSAPKGVETHKSDDPQSDQTSYNSAAPKPEATASSLEHRKPRLPVSGQVANSLGRAHQLGLKGATETIGRGGGKGYAVTRGFLEREFDPRELLENSRTADEEKRGLDDPTENRKTIGGEEKLGGASGADAPGSMPILPDSYGSIPGPGSFQSDGSTSRRQGRVGQHEAGNKDDLGGCGSSGGAQSGATEGAKSLANGGGGMAQFAPPNFGPAFARTSLRPSTSGSVGSGPADSAGIGGVGSKLDLNGLGTGFVSTRSGAAVEPTVARATESDPNGNSVPVPEEEHSTLMNFFWRCFAIAVSVVIVYIGIRGVELLYRKWELRYGNTVILAVEDLRPSRIWRLPFRRRTKTPS